MTNVVNFTVQDLVGFFIAFFLFALVLLAPGFVIGWAFDLFNFRLRSKTGQTLLGIILSFAISPVIFNLIGELASTKWALWIAGGFGVVWPIIIIRCFFNSKAGNTDKEPSPRLRFYRRLAGGIAILWVFGTILMLMDIQWGDRLYFNTIAYDLTTRALIVDAMSRTGIPPINPSYFPGEPVHLTYLYYFWYSLCSLIDILGGHWVDGRMAMLASSAWCGLGLTAAIGLYTQIRSPNTREKIWKYVLVGVGLLAVSGLDVIPASTNMLSSRLSFGFMWPPGDIEHWNEPITAWIGAIYWAPNHIAGLIACLIGLMAYYQIQRKKPGEQITMMLVAGLAFASAVGLSIWVTATFALFWGILIIRNILKKEFRLAGMMIIPGIVALIAAMPFLMGLFQGNGTQGNFPVAFHIRPFGPANPYLTGTSTLIAPLLYLLCLPINYFLELGFFSLAGLIWMNGYRPNPDSHKVIYETEQMLLAIVLLVGSFVRSTAIQANDLGWRCWLLGQFILLIWAIDIIKVLSKENIPNILSAKTHNLIQRVRKYLIILAAIGIFTTVFDLALLRTFPMLVDANIAGFPNNGLSPDTKLGQRTLAARLTYNYIRDKFPENVVVQYNPTRKIDRPAGLYGSKQMAISDLSAFGVPISDFEWQAKQIGTLFTTSHSDWQLINMLCSQYSIDALIINDTDPVWSSISSLEQEQVALYKNSFYAVYTCGVPGLNEGDN